MIDLSPADEMIVNAILKKHVAKCEVRAFGSRHKWTAKSYSDLDLAIVGTVKLDKSVIYALQEAFEESELSFRVDVLDWYAISDEFRQIIEQGYSVIQEKEIDNQLPAGWMSRKLGEHCKKIASGATPTGGNDAYQKSGMSLIRSQNIHDFTFSYNGLAFINEQQANKLKNVEVQQNDVLLNITGDSVARCCSVPCDILPARVNQHVMIIRPDERIFNAKFLQYYLLNRATKKYLLSIAASGATRNALTKGHIENLDIIAPSIEEQKKIAAILSSLDDKIELNRQTNQTLEEVAQALFKEWFIDFNFPDENGNPYRDSGGSMIDSELGKIPAFWTVGSVSDICDYVASGGTPSTKENSYYEDGIIKWFTTKELNDGFIFDSEKKISETGLSNSSAKIFPKHAVLVAMYGATAGKIAILSKSATFNQATCGMVVNKNISSAWFLYLWLLNYREHLVSLSNGAAQQNLNVGQIKNYPILLLDSVTNKKFSNFVENVFLQIEQNSGEILILKNTRDTLLPKLISGELDVKNYIGDQ